MTATLAAIDIGSNTVQLLLARTAGRRIIARENFIQTTRLGATIGANQLTSEAIAATAAAVRCFVSQAQDAGADKIKIMATSAVRDASNQQEFLTAIKQVTDIPVAILSGIEEAQTSYRGALSLLAFAPGTPVLDVGGSSTELIYGFSEDDIICTSVNIGAVRMKRNHWDTAQMQTILAQGFTPRGNSQLAVGIGGTITDTAGVLAGLSAYDRDAIEGMIITKEQLQKLLECLLPLSLEERCRYSPLLCHRGEIIEQGLQIWIGLAELLGFNKILICGGGILDGAIADML